MRIVAGSRPAFELAACHRLLSPRSITDLMTSIFSACFENGVGRPPGALPATASAVRASPSGERPSVVPSDAPGHPALKMGWDGRLGHCQQQHLLCVLPRVGSDRRWCLRMPPATLVFGLTAPGASRPVATVPEAVSRHRGPVFMRRWCPTGACGTGLKIAWSCCLVLLLRQPVPGTPCSLSLPAGARGDVPPLDGRAHRSSGAQDRGRRCRHAAGGRR
jgi:hypothetical protein